MSHPGASTLSLHVDGSRVPRFIHMAALEAVDSFNAGKDFSASVRDACEGYFNNPSDGLSCVLYYGWKEALRGQLGGEDIPIIHFLYDVRDEAARILSAGSGLEGALSLPVS